MPSPDLRAAVIGVGHLGRHHARILAGLEGVDLVAVVDPDAARCREHAERWGATPLASAEEVVDLVDLAVVATPTVHHAAAAGPLLDAGCAVLIEKPLAPDPATCRALVERAKAGGAPLGVGHVERFNPAVRRARGLGIRPRFIEAHRLSSFPFRATDVGVVMDLMIHDLDLVLDWIAEPVESLTAVGGSVLTETEDMASVRLQFRGGAVANLTASRLSLKPMRRFRVFGPDCYVSIDSGERYALMVQKSDKFDREGIDWDAASQDPASAFRDLLHVEELQLDDDEPLRAELQGFLDALRRKEEPPVSGEAGLRAVELAHRILEALDGSLWAGGSS